MFLSNFLSNFTVSRGNAFIWDSKIKNLKIISHFRCLDLDLLIGIERQKKTIYDNTINFAEGNFTNNALLWGSRGNGKSSLIKSTLDGSIQNQPKNIVLYVTSNRRHLMPRDMIAVSYTHLTLPTKRIV